MRATFSGLGPPNHNKDGLSGPNSVMVVYVDPPGHEMRYRHVALREYFRREKSLSSGMPIVATPAQDNLHGFLSTPYTPYRQAKSLQVGICTH